MYLLIELRGVKTGNSFHWTNYDLTTKFYKIFKSDEIFFSNKPLRKKTLLSRFTSQYRIPILIDPIVSTTTSSIFVVPFKLHESPRSESVGRKGMKVLWIRDLDPKLNPVITLLESLSGWTTWREDLDINISNRVIWVTVIYQ